MATPERLAPASHPAGIEKQAQLDSVQPEEYIRRVFQSGGSSHDFGVITVNKHGSRKVRLAGSFQTLEEAVEAARRRNERAARWSDEFNPPPEYFPYAKTGEPVASPQQ